MLQAATLLKDTFEDYISTTQAKGERLTRKGVHMLATNNSEAPRRIKSRGFVPESRYAVGPDMENIAQLLRWATCLTDWVVPNEREFWPIGCCAEACPITGLEFKPSRYRGPAPNHWGISLTLPFGSSPLVFSHVLMFG